MATFLERYQGGDHVAVWDDLTALGEGVRHELYLADAQAVAAETMRRARQNVEVLIGRLADKGYRFLDTVSSAEDRLSRLDTMEQFAAQIQARRPEANQYNSHALQMLEGLKAIKAKMAPMLEKAAAEAAKAAAAARKPPLEDPQVFRPPDKTTPRLLAQLEKSAGGPLPLSLRAWYEQVGGVSLMGSHPVLNAVEFSNRNVLTQFAMMQSGQGAPVPSPDEDCQADPLVVFPLEELLGQAGDGENGDGEGLQVAIAPDDLHKANISGDAYYLTLPDARADFHFDDWHNTTFV
ncbi:MAG TPA: hypothetical protein VGF59_32030, partial [Bryobacteraceae bacterium]